MDKTLEQQSAGSAYETGAIYKKAIDKLVDENFSNTSGASTLTQNTGDALAETTDPAPYIQSDKGTAPVETNPANGEQVDPSTMIDPNQQIA
ncbi:hypothetical protein H8D85_02675 [bacterium]|nr:hypothetical protein [bacterium]